MEPVTFGSLKIQPDSTYQIPNLLPGEYEVTLTADQASASRVRFPVTVVDRDVDVGSVTVPPPVTLAGVFTAAPSATIPAAHGVRGITLIATDLRIPPQLFRVSMLASGDGKFSFNALPQGRYRVVANGLPSNSYIASVRYGQADITDGILEISGVPSGPLNVVFDAPAGMIEGVATDAAGRPVSFCQIVLIPPQKRRSNRDLFKVESADQNGHFSIRDVPVGDYAILAFQELQPETYMNSDFLKSVESRAVPVSVTRGGTAMANVRVVPASK